MLVVRGTDNTRFSILLDVLRDKKKLRGEKNTVIRKVFLKIQVSKIANQEMRNPARSWETLVENY
jgi:hypothetical protein